MKKLFTLICFWKDNVAIERFKYPKTIELIESNIQKLKKKVIESDNADWYVPPSSYYVGEEYTMGSLTSEPNFNDYDEFYQIMMHRKWHSMTDGQKQAVSYHIENNKV